MSITDLERLAQQAEDAPVRAIEGRSQWWLTRQRLRRDKVAMTSLAVIIIMILLAIFAPAFAALVHHPANVAYPITGENSAGQPVGPGTNGFWLGTDDTGRDLMVRVFYGARISLFVGIVTTAIATVAGVAIGLIAGYFGGIIDTILARLTDAVLAFPYVVLALALAVVFGPSLTIVIAVISFFSWAGIARIVRGQTLSLKEKEYIEAARSIGAGPFRIMFIDILPNVIAPIIVYTSLLIPVSIVAEASLSFLGVGIPPPTPDWGSMIADSQTVFEYGAWWYLVFPSLALLITTLAFNIFGDGVRDAFDPRGGQLFV